MKEYLKNKWWAIILLVIIFVSLIGAAIFTCLYWVQFHKMNLSNDPQNWGVFGDYFGGTLNPLLTIVNICITIWLTIILAQYEDINTEKQIKAERNIVRIQIRHEALKELRSEINLNFSEWSKANNNPDYAKKCKQTLTEFSSNYAYLFDLNNITSLKRLISIINSVQISIQNNDLTNILQGFMQANMGRETLLSELGENVLK